MSLAIAVPSECTDMPERPGWGVGYRALAARRHPENALISGLVCREAPVCGAAGLASRGDDPGTGPEEHAVLAGVCGHDLAQVRLGLPLADVVELVEQPLHLADQERG